jgi:anti-sigma B factor antagonist
MKGNCMQLKSYDKNGITVVEIEGRLDASCASVLKAKFRELSANQNNFVMDLSNMDYIDSTGLGSIVSCLKVVSTANGDIKLACLKDKPRMIFEITRAYKIFDIFDDLNAAVESFIQ